MASNLRRWSKVFVVCSGLAVAGSGCGDSFTTGSAGGSSSTGGGGAGGTTASTGGGGSTTTGPECSQGQTKPCYTGKSGTEGVGICKAGVYKCVDGAWGDVCNGQVTPEATETCDGADNNCNSKTDEGCSCTDGDKQNCTEGSGTPGVGICKSGKQLCSGGAWGACEGAVGAQTETCANMGADDDCNGVLDDVPNAGTGCDTGGQGICNAGTRHCVNETLTCVQNADPTSETCMNQGADNDCNGITDDVSGLGAGCAISLPMGGSCSGTSKCGPNGMVCVASVYFAEDFGNPQGWKTDNEWAFGPTSASNGQTMGNGDPAMDRTPTADNKIAGVVLGGNASNETHEPYYLTSKVIDINKNTPVFLSYWRWLNSDLAPAMIDTVEVTTNGQVWTLIWTNTGTSIADNSWVLQTFDLAQYKSATFQFRFGVEVTVGGPIVSSWNVDDITIASCPVMP